MQGINEVRLVGTISRIYPIKYFDNKTCMVLAEITTNDGTEVFTHTVSMVNDDAIHFSNTATLGAWVDMSGKLRPRLKDQNNPSSGTFFEIRCLRFVFIAETPIKPKESVYPAQIDEPAKESKVKVFLKKFSPQSRVNTSSEEDQKKVSFVATEEEKKKFTN